MADLYTVTNFAQGRRTAANGALQDVMTVYFELTNGQGSGWVEVPLVDGWDQTAADAINQRVMQMAAVAAG